MSKPFSSNEVARKSPLQNRACSLLHQIAPICRHLGAHAWLCQGKKKNLCCSSLQWMGGAQAKPVSLLHSLVHSARISWSWSPELGCRWQSAHAVGKIWAHPNEGGPSFLTNPYAHRVSKRRLLQWQLLCLAYLQGYHQDSSTMKEFHRWPGSDRAWWASWDQHPSKCWHIAARLLSCFTWAAAAIAPAATTMSCRSAPAPTTRETCRCTHTQDSSRELCRCFQGRRGMRSWCFQRCWLPRPDGSHPGIHKW